MSGTHAKDKSAQNPRSAQAKQTAGEKDRHSIGQAIVAILVAIIGVAGAWGAAAIGRQPTAVLTNSPPVGPGGSAGARTPTGPGTSPSSAPGGVATRRKNSLPASPAPTASSPSPATKPPAGSVATWPSVKFYGNDWVDFDKNPPGQQAVQGDKPPANVDVQIGPDNAYSDNARIWVSNGPTTCKAQAVASPGEGFQVALDLVKALPAPGWHVTLCIDTTMHRVGTLDVSSVNGDGHAPYLFRYSF